MAITETDLIFLESERLDDTSSGGGRMTGNVVPDGEENNLFPDVAPTDRVFGRVRMRKIFAANHSNSIDLYLGAHVIVSHPPADDYINVTLFSTGDWLDTRDEARDYIERYLARSGYWPGYLYGDHLEGQRAVQIVQFPNTDPPVVGQTLVLIQDEGGVSEIEQYVRITRITSEMRTFVDGQGSFERLVVLAEISDPLRYDFNGIEPSRYTSQDPETVLRDTIASAAARYYSVRTLTAQANVSERELTVDSIYTPLVPSVQTENPILDAQAGGTKDYTLSCGTRTASLNQVAHTDWVQISAANQALNYTALLLPKPAAGTVTVSYRAQGKWYSLTDNGTGGLTGTGAGTLNYSTGSALITLSALPDIGSAILWGWGGSVHAVATTLDGITFDIPGWMVQLQHDAIETGSLTVTWTSGTATKKVIDQAGKLIGDGNGQIDYVTGKLYFKPVDLPDPVATPVITYRYGAPETESFTPTLDGNRFVTITVANPPVLPNSVSAVFTTRRRKTEQEKIVEETT